MTKTAQIFSHLKVSTLVVLFKIIWDVCVYDEKNIVSCVCIIIIIISKSTMLKWAQLYITFVLEVHYLVSASFLCRLESNLHRATASECFYSDVLQGQREEQRMFKS